MTQFEFDCLDEAVSQTSPTGRGLVPEQDITCGAYVYACSYAGGNFYIEVHVEDMDIWMQDGI
jgi:hypothetical protein